MIYICILYIYRDIRIYDYVSRLLRTAITKWINSTCPGIFFATGSLDEPRVVSSIHFLWLSIEVGEEKSMFSGSINYIYIYIIGWGLNIFLCSIIYGIILPID